MITIEDRPELTMEDAERAKLCLQRPIFFEPWLDYDEFGGSGRTLGRGYHCPECGEWTEKKRKGAPKHGERMECRCGHRGAALSLNRYSRFDSLSDENYFMFCKERDGWLWLIAAEGNRYYDREELDPEPRLNVMSTYAFKPGERHAWTWRWKTWGQKEWREKKDCGKPFKGKNYKKSPSYALIGAEEIEKSEMRYCALDTAWSAMVNHDIFEDERTAVTDAVEKYLWLYAKYPAVEMIVKMGFVGIIYDYLRGDGMGPWKWKARTPWEFFRMKKRDYKEFCRRNMKPEDIRTKVRCLPEESMEEYVRLKEIWKNHLEEAVRMYKHKRYWKKLCSWYPGHDWVIWQDTLDMERMAGNDTEFESVLMPENLQERHDELEQMREKLTEKANEKTYRKRRKMLRDKYEFTASGLEIRVPKSAGEIEREGKLLRHCVAGYADRHIKGVKCILFLRWSDDRSTPYMTVEINERTETIVQIHGFHNDLWSMSPWEIHGDFLQMWMDWVKAGSLRDQAGNPVVSKSA